jgi:ABC-type nitrate/sulfonate/bicarbonate transport system ATPase subunit
VEALSISSAPGSEAQALMEPLLGLKNIVKRFGEVTAIDGVNLDIARGEFVTLVGPSGCGKSTLFNIVAGLLEPDPGGEIAMGGKLVGAGGLLGKVSFMPQRDLLFPWRTVLENAVLPNEIEGKPRAESLAKARTMCVEFGLKGFEDKYPQQLSGGMRQRVALMRTFMFERDLMLLDEPFGALDSLTRSLMQRWLLGIWEHHRRTVLFITHDIDEALYLGDRVVAMTARPGRIKQQFSVTLPRPREPALLTSAEFIALKRKLLDAIEAESLKAFSGHDE